MTLTDPPSRAARRSFRIGAWALLVVGVVHNIVVDVLGNLDPPAAERPARDAARAASTALLARDLTVLQLNTGYSVAMGLLLVGVAATGLAAVRQAPALLSGGSVFLWLYLVLAIACLAVAVLAFPEPAIIATAVSVAGFAFALRYARRAGNAGNAGNATDLR